MNAGVDTEEWADLEKGPLGAVVDLSGCSGAFVSPDGLVATAFAAFGPIFNSLLETAKIRSKTAFMPPREEERWTGPSSKFV